MGVTHLDALTLTGTAQAATLVLTGAGGITATGALSTFKNATVVGTVQSAKGTFTGAVKISGAVTATGGASTVKTIESTGTALFDANFRMASGANLPVGRRMITTGGSATISNTLVAKSSRVFLNYRGVAKNASPLVMTQTGSSMKVGLFTGLGTAATGTVNYMIVNI